MNGTEQNPRRWIASNASQRSMGFSSYEEETDKYLALKRERPFQILIVSDDAENCVALTIILGREGWDTVCTSSVSESNKVLSVSSFDLVFCDRYLPDGSYRDVLAIITTLNYHLPLVVTCRHADWDQYLEALRHGAFELIVAPCRGSDVLRALTQADRRH
jgi:DNA-binding NtrC family response regulator